MATLSSVLAWRIPGMGEPGGLPSMGSHRVGHDWSDLAAAAAARVNVRKKIPVRGQSTWREWWEIMCNKQQVAEPGGEGNGSPRQYSCLENPMDGGAGGLLSMGLHRVGHDWSNAAAAAEPGGAHGYLGVCIRAGHYGFFPGQTPPPCPLPASCLYK